MNLLAADFANLTSVTSAGEFALSRSTPQTPLACKTSADLRRSVLPEKFANRVADPDMISARLSCKALAGPHRVLDQEPYELCSRPGQYLGTLVLCSVSRIAQVTLVQELHELRGRPRQHFVALVLPRRPRSACLAKP